IHPVNIQYDDSSLLAGKSNIATRNCKYRFVGRHDEISFFNERLAEGEQGTGSILCVSGPSGIGKPARGGRLRREGESRAMVARSRCAPGLSDTELYAPFIDAFTDLFNASTDADLRHRLKEVAPAWSCQAALALGQGTDNSGPVGDPTNSLARQFVAA